MYISPSRMSEAESFQQQALLEVSRRGVEKATTVCAVSDGADWIQKWVDDPAARRCAFSTLPTR
jgi:hypothetical protein